LGKKLERVRSQPAAKAERPAWLNQPMGRSELRPVALGRQLGVLQLYTTSYARQDIYHSFIMDKYSEGSV
jgi:hypothetical protein